MNIYRLDDAISFRKCTLYKNDDKFMSVYGDCTNFRRSDPITFVHGYECNQYGIHLHCTKHPNIELTTDDNESLKCPKCGKIVHYGDVQKVIKECMKVLNYEKFKDAKIIRLDDWYVHEVKDKKKITNSDYWVTTNVKTDKDGDTIIIIYVGLKGSSEKVQYFIKPEKCQLTNDHKDFDPQKILSKIEVVLKNRTLVQEYFD